jgi:phosphohistidine swiveling domain-containing protein
VVQSATEDFKVVWKDPSDAKKSWVLDAMHFPRPMPALTAQLIARVRREIFNGAQSIFVNGYAYAVDAFPPPPTPEVIQRGPFDVWENDYVPRIRAICQRIRGTDYDSMSAEQLAGSLHEIVADTMEAFRYTMVVVYAFMGPTFQLVEFFEKKLGEDGPPLLATLLQGTNNRTSASGSGLADLARLAAGLPEVASALRERRYDDIEGVAGGAEFQSSLRRYLDEFGWRAESWGLPHVPTWAEDPHTPLLLVARYLDDPNHSPDAAIQRAQRQHDEAMRELESRLSGEELAELKSKLAACEGHVAISEGRAMWQLTIVGSTRVPLLALGRKLVEAGALDDPNDVFFFELEELKEAARGPSPSYKATAAARKAELARWEQLDPPPFVGAPPEIPPEMQTLVSKFFGLGVEPSREENVIKGNAASRGSARGRARVIHELAEADRLQKGDVLVCPTTAPPWTPLFALAAAVVTDSGGILSHSAICAREYGIPCVVGTQVGTSKIPDGAMISVDGAEGIVRIEGAS